MPNRLSVTNASSTNSTLLSMARICRRSAGGSGVSVGTLPKDRGLVEFILPDGSAQPYSQIFRSRWVNFPSEVCYRRRLFRGDLGCETSYCQGEEHGPGDSFQSVGGRDWPHGRSPVRPIVCRRAGGQETGRQQTAAGARLPV